MFTRPAVFTLVLSTFSAACGDGNDVKSDAEFQAETVEAMHASIEVDLADLADAARELQAAAPETAWSAADPAAITAMRTAWRKTRVAYEHVEGATAPIFADFDGSMDARYDDYLIELGAAGDPDPFDGEGVTGMHGIERILFADEIRDNVIEFEESLPGYSVARFPETDEEALAFKNELVQRLIDDADELHAQWQPAAIDIGGAFVGLIGLMNEQQEKVDLASTGEEESRYANVTLFDLRNNLEGTRQIYDLFVPWILSHEGGADANEEIQAQLDALDDLYTDAPGDALPDVPATWSSDAPTADDLATPFGQLWSAVDESVDPTLEGSVVFEMNEIAAFLGFDQFVAE
jgi:iron uptake system component EfeO